MVKNLDTQNIKTGEDSNRLHSIFRKSKVVASRFKRKVVRHVWLLRILVVTFVLALFYVAFVVSFDFLGGTSVGFYADLAKNFIFTPSSNIQSFNGRTNILILGKGGKGHEAPDLTDTIILASVTEKDPSITLISFPRDIWIAPLETKLNSMYYWGNKRQKGGGLVLAKSTIEEISGQPVHYALVVDFSGFKDIVDILGGIEVDVGSSFTDERYPIAGKENDLCDGDPEYKCRYETIHFEKGLQYMDGETALKFVRSRNAEGDNGTDIARAARQQKVIAAIKEKVLSREIMFSPKKLFGLRNAVLSFVETDITPQAAAILARRFLNARDDTSTHVVGEDLLINPPISPEYDNLYVFIPKSDKPTKDSEQDWTIIHKWVSCILNKNTHCGV